MNSPDFVVDWIPKKLFARVSHCPIILTRSFGGSYYALVIASPAVTGIFIDAELGDSAKVPDGTRVKSCICAALTIAEKTFRTG
jgi:hypothetical protein